MRLTVLALAGVITSALAHVDDWTAGAQSAGNASLLWGSYRPGLYVGFRARQPDSLLFGLLWFGALDYTSVSSASSGSAASIERG